MKPKATLRRFCVLVGSSMMAVSSAHAATLYWDVDGTTGGFSTPVGTWNTTNNFWNTDSGGGAGTLTNTTTAADDLIIPQSTTDTGTLSVSGTQNASSITFAANIGPTVTMSGGTSITIGGTGAKNGIFQESSGANSITTTPLRLKSDITAFNFSNSSSGLLTIGTGGVTGLATTGTQTITVGTSSTGGITLSGVIGNGAAGGNVALNVNSSGTGITLLSGVNTFSGGLTLTAGTLRANTTASALGAGSLTLNGGILELTHGAALNYNRNTTVGGDVTIISSNNGTTAGWNFTIGTLSIGANTLSIQGSAALASGQTAGITFGATTLTGNAIFNVVNPASGGTTLTLGAVGGGFGITKNGSGTLALNTANSYSGTTIINAGTLLLNADNTYSGGTTINGGIAYFASKTAMPATGNVTVNDGGVLGVNLGTAGTVWSTGTSGAGTLGGLLTGVGGQTGSTVSYAGNTTLKVTLSDNVSYGDIGNVGTTLALWKDGASTLTLTGSNTYSGTTTVSEGTLVLSGSNSSAGATTVSGGILQLNSNSNGGLASGTFTVGGGTVQALNADRTISQAITLSGNATFSGNYSITSPGQMNGGAASRIITNNITAGKTLNIAGYTSSAGNLNFQGTGTTIMNNAITLSGQLTFDTGTVMLNAGGNTSSLMTIQAGGTVIARSGANLGSTLSMVTGSSFSYVAASDVNMGSGAAGSITLNNNNTLGGSIGSTTDSARIFTTNNVAFATGVGSRNVTVNVYGVPGVSRTVDGNYQLIRGASAGTNLTNGVYTLGTVFNNTDFTVGAITTGVPTGGGVAVFIGVTRTTALTGAYWIGGLSGNTTVWAASTGVSGGSSNWATASNGAAQVLIPGAGADVIIDANGTATTSTRLGADVHIKTLSLTKTTGLGINADGFKLTITPDAAANGITISNAVTADSTIASNVGLGAAQTWTNNSANALTVSGVISGSSTLTTAGSGKIILSGVNTYTGATTVSAGTLLVTGSLVSDVTVSGTGVLGGGGTVDALIFGGDSFFDMFQAISNSDALTAATISFAAAGFGIDNLVYNGAPVDWGTISNGTYTLITGTLDETNLENFGIGSAYLFGDGRGAYFQEGSLQLVVAAIPEPHVALLGGLGVLLLLRRRRH